MKNQTFLDALSSSTLEEIPALLNKIRSNYENIPSYQRGTFNQLVTEFSEPPNNFQFSTWKSRLKVYVSGLDIQIDSSSNTSIVVGNGNTVMQGTNHGTVINNFGSSGSDYGKDKEIQGMKKAIELLTEKQDYLLQDFHISSGQQKFSLQKNLEEIETELKNYRTKISQYEGESARNILILVNQSIAKTPTESVSLSRPSRKIQTVFSSLEDKVVKLEKEINNPSSEIVVDLAIQFCKDFRTTLNESNNAFDKILKIEGKLNAAKIKLERTSEVSIYDDINEIAQKAVKLFKESNEVVPKEDAINYQETLEGLKSKLQKRHQDQETKDWLEATISAISNLHKLNQPSREKAVQFKAYIDSFITKASQFASAGAKIGFDFDSL